MATIGPPGGSITTRVPAAGHDLIYRTKVWVRLVTVALALAFVPIATVIAAERPYLPAVPGGLAAGSGEGLTEDAQGFVAWVIETGDNRAAPFLVIDKVNATAFAFNREGGLLASSPVLLGLARGDVSPVGIGGRALSSIGPADRITPAGRFEAAQGVNLEGRKVLWVDYDTALSLHPVVTGAASDRRRQRLASVTASDNRISYGCINVPPSFYAEVIAPLFTTNIGIVYILPETRSIRDVFVARAPSSQ
ncbi:MAG: L,D-transpeptidase [Caulobacter sp.]|nr:L,D-transpeptidase [Caulobacter sp.]